MDEEMQRYRVEQAHSYLERIRKLGSVELDGFCAWGERKEVDE